MNAIAYLIRTRFKNSLKSIIHTPSKLAYFIFMIAIFGLVIVSGLMGRSHSDHFRPREELYALLLAFYAGVFLLSSAKGLGNGASFYTMADVGLLFSAPVSPKRILIYGLVRQLGTAILMALVLLYQYSWLTNLYGIGGLDMLAIMLGYMLTVFCSQLLAMCIYSFTSGSEKRSRAVQAALIALAVILVAGAAYPMLGADDMIAALARGANAAWTDYFPVAGWLRAAAAGLMAGNYLALALGVAAVIAFTGVFVAIIFKVDADFYEDVLFATEANNSAVTAKKEGRIGEVLPKNVKLGRQGLGRGRGASAFYFKHRIEDRRARIFLTDRMNLLFMAISLIFAFAMRAQGIYSGFFFSVYMMMFGSFTSRWVRELQQPYAYMAPVSPFKKLVMICGSFIIKSVREAVVLMVIMCLIVGVTADVMLAAVLARCSFALLFIASNILTERLFGEIPGRMIQIFFYFLVLVLLVAPGIILSFVLLGKLGQAAVLFGVAVWNTLASAVITALCRNILVIAELNNN